MGIFTSCCKPSAAEVLTPDAETRRRQLVEAAEKRRAEEASRGVKDPERVKRMQQRTEEMEKREQELAKQGGSNLKGEIRSKAGAKIKAVSPSPKKRNTNTKTESDPTAPRIRSVV